MHRCIILHNNACVYASSVHAQMHNFACVYAYSICTRNSSGCFEHLGDLKSSNIHHFESGYNNVFSWVLNAKKLRLPSGFKPSEPHLSAYLVASGTSNDSAGPRMNHQVSMRFFMPCPGVHGCTRCGVCVCGTSEQTLNFEPGLVTIYYIRAGGVAAVSPAMPMKLWDSAGWECGRTFLYLQI